MAFIGMRHVVVAKVASHTDGSEPTYTAGMVAGKAISGNLTITRNNNPLRADDDIAENDNGITDMTLDLGTDDLLEDVQAYMGMLKSKTTGTGDDAVELVDEIIEKINEQYNGTFTDADRVVVSAMKDKLMADEKLQSMAKTSDPQIFNDSVFPKFFNLIAQDCYTESQDAFTSLFADQAKYNAVMHALSSVIYRDMRKTV